MKIPPLAAARDGYVKPKALTKVREWGVEDGAERAEAVQQCFSSGFDVAVGNTEGEKELNDFVFGKAGEATLEESLPQALPVSVIMRSFHCSGEIRDETRRNDGTEPEGMQ